MGREDRGWLRDATLVALLGTGFLSFTGFQWVRLYYTSLGLPAEGLVFSPHVYLQASFFPLVMAVFLLGLLALVVRFVEQTGHGSRWVRFDALAGVAVTAVVTGVVQAVRFATRDPEFSDRFSFVFFVVFFMALGCVGVYWVWHERVRPRIRSATDRAEVPTLGVVGAVMVIFFFWVVAVGADAERSAMDLRDGCLHDEVRFTPTPPGLDDQWYVHLLHHDGRYYLRDPGLPPENTAVLVVMDDQVDVAFFKTAGVRDC